MPIGIDDIDFEDEAQITQQDEPQNPIVDQDDEFITELLKDRGIEDKSRIKFEDEAGNVNEVDWNTLSNQEKLNVLNTSSYQDQDDLDDNEVDLINSIRSTGMTPKQWLQKMQNDTLSRYMQNNTTPQYSVDQYSDDELFIADFISRTGDVSQEEAQEALEKAKSNPGLFAKQIGAIRKEYKTIEQENQQQAELEQQQQAQEQYNRFAQQVADEINSFTELQGYDLNLERNDMQDLYDFITGRDAQGNNHFAKALTDPKILVETAWFALNGKQMIDDITQYFQREITKVRKESYNKGLNDAKMGKSRVVYKDKPARQNINNDIDDF